MILPTSRQIQLIADSLQDPADTPQIDAAQLTRPWCDFHTWIREWIDEDPADTDPRKLRHDFLTTHARYGHNPVDGFADYYSLIEQAIATPLTYPSADQTLAQVRDLQWLWKGWLLRGLPSLLAAVPGTGKSYLALDIARRILSHSHYPDGQPVEDHGPVLYVDAENTPTIHKTRLSVWPQPLLKHLYIMLPADNRYVINLGDVADRDRLSDMAWFLRPALIIIDSYGACTLKGENNKEDVQELLAYFTRLAKDFDCGLLIIHHLRKGANVGPLPFAPMTIDSIRGSSHIPAMARHIWGLQFVPAGPEPGLDDPRRLWIMKTNLGTSPDPLGVTFDPHPDNPDVAQLTFGDAPQPYKEMSKVEQCAEWILTQLREAGAPIKPAHFIEQAEVEGFYSSLIYRARKHLGDLIVDSEQQSRNPNNTWALAGTPEDDDVLH